MCFSPLEFCLTGWLASCFSNLWPCCCAGCGLGNCFGNFFKRTNFQFVKSAPGIARICETLISGLILWLLVEYELNYSLIIGLAFEGSLITTSACFVTCALLLVCYVTSEKDFLAIRFSQFEITFNFVACLLYLSSAYYLADATKVILIVKPADSNVYPAMTIAYVITQLISLQSRIVNLMLSLILSGVVGLIHAADVYMCYYKTGR